MWYLAGLGDLDSFFATSITVSADVVKAVQKYGPEAVDLVKKYGPQAGDIIVKYGAAAVPYIKQYGSQAISLIRQYGLSAAISMLRGVAANATAPKTTPGAAFASMGSSNTMLLVGAAAVLAVLLLRR